MDGKYSNDFWDLPVSSLFQTVHGNIDAIDEVILSHYDTYVARIELDQLLDEMNELILHKR
jgi:hypothetical protein